MHDIGFEMADSCQQRLAHPARVCPRGPRDEPAPQSQASRRIGELQPLLSMPCPRHRLDVGDVVFRLVTLGSESRDFELGLAEESGVDASLLGFV